MNPAQKDWRTRIVRDRDLHHGEPCIRGTRISVAVIVASMADFSAEEILTLFPQLTKDDLAAALRFAAEASHNWIVV